MRPLARSTQARFLTTVVVAVLGMAATPAPADRSLVRFRIGEAVVQDWLRAVTPYTVSVGADLLRTELVFSDPQGLTLRNGQASFRVRVRGKTLPIDQTLEPVVTLRHDPRLNRFTLVVSSLTVTLPGFGTLDLRESMPGLEVPALIDHLWNGTDRALGIHLGIRRVAILDHAVEIEADATVRPAPAHSASVADPGGLHGR